MNNEIFERCVQSVMESGRMETIGRALIWALENNQSSWIDIAETPAGSFCSGYDIECLIELYKEGLLAEREV